MRRELSTGPRRQPWQPFVDLMLANTVRLMRNVHQYPTNLGVASGVLTEADANLLLLTAGHSFDQPGPWTLETRYCARGRTLHLPLRDIQRLATINLVTGETEPVDLAWAWVDRVAAGTAFADDSICADTTVSHRGVELPVYRGSLDAEPTMDAEYGYASWNRVEVHRATGILAAEASWEVGMRFLGMHSSLHVYEFELSRPHQGHKYYQGASGAPIADATGRIVSLLLAGDPARNRLFGIPLSRFSSVLGIGRQA